MSFNKPKAKYNIVNDLDSDVFNLFQVVMNQKEELEKAFYMIPIHSDLLDYWKKNEENDPIKKALRFLFLSNFATVGGGGKMIRYSELNYKENFKLINETFDYLSDVILNNCDCNSFLNKISVDYTKALIYCDPPYLGTSDNYSNSFTEEQSESLFNTLEETKCKFAMSEFDHPFILSQAEKRGLNVIIIGERQNIKNRRTEILVTNYENRQLKLL